MASIVQLQYALAVAEHGSFLAAAKACHVTQPTLSMQIQKMEEEYEVALFDRTRKPIVPTSAGSAILEQARAVVREYNKIESIALRAKDVVAGSYRLAVIPTISSFLLPRFIPRFQKLYPEVHLAVRELTTAEIIRSLHEGTIDAGILATPLRDSKISEAYLYDEPMVVYHSKGFQFGHRRKLLDPDQLPLENLIIMSDGHCLRTQTLDLCNLVDRAPDHQGFSIQTGNIDTLMKLIDTGDHFGILPAGMVHDLPKSRRETQVAEFASPIPFREISLVTHRSEVQAAIDAAAIRVAKELVPDAFKERKKGGKLLEPV